VEDAETVVVMVSTKKTRPHHHMKSFLVTVQLGIHQVQLVNAFPLGFGVFAPLFSTSVGVREKTGLPEDLPCLIFMELTRFDLETSF
jgi:hypothetical protein